MQPLMFALITIVTLAVVGLLTYVVIIPTVSGTLAKRDEIDSSKARLATLVKKRTLLESVTRELVATYLADAELALPHEKDGAGILIGLENLAAQTQFTIDTIELSPGLVSTLSAASTQSPAAALSGADQKKSGAETLAVTVAGQGSSDQLIAFLASLQSTRRLFQIDGIDVMYTDPAGDRLNAQFTLVAFYLPPVTEIGKIGSAIPELTTIEEDRLKQIAALPITSSLSISLEGTTSGSLPIGKANLFE